MCSSPFISTHGKSQAQNGEASPKSHRQLATNLRLDSTSKCFSFRDTKSFSNQLPWSFQRPPFKSLPICFQFVSRKHASIRLGSVEHSQSITPTHFVVGLLPARLPTPYDPSPTSHPHRRQDPEGTGHSRQAHLDIGSASREMVGTACPHLGSAEYP